jgi:hypothetical protein
MVIPIKILALRFVHLLISRLPLACFSTDLLQKNYGKLCQEIRMKVVPRVKLDSSMVYPCTKMTTTCNKMTTTFMKMTDWSILCITEVHNQTLD